MWVRKLWIWHYSLFMFHCICRYQKLYIAYYSMIIIIIICMVHLKQSDCKQAKLNKVDEQLVL